MDTVRELLNYLHECIQSVCERYQVDFNLLSVSLNEYLTNAAVHGNLEATPE
jgi:hypothetical protein